MRIAAVVVTYNRLDTLRRCLAAVAGQQPAAPDILVVDNHSTDGTAAFLAEQAAAGRLQYRDTGANIGGAGGFSAGMGWAVEAGYTHLWVMDDDCIPQPDALAALVAAHEQLNGNYGFLSGIAYWRDGSRCRMNIQKRTLTARLERLAQVLGLALRYFLLSAGMFVPVWLVGQACKPGLPGILLQIGTGILVYGAGLILLRDPAWRELRRFLRRKKDGDTPQPEEETL